MDINAIIYICLYSLFVILLIITVYFSTKRSILRKLERLAEKPIDTLQNNEFAKVSGKAFEFETPLIAPLSFRKCVFYMLKIEHRKSFGRSSHWKQLIHEEHVQDFFVEQNGAFITIKLTQVSKNYKAFLTFDTEMFSKDGNPIFQDLLKDYKIKSTTLLGFKKTLRMREAIISIGETITVAGMVHRQPLDRKIIAEFLRSEMLMLKATAKKKLIIADLPLNSIKAL